MSATIFFEVYHLQSHIKAIISNMDLCAQCVIIWRHQGPSSAGYYCIINLIWIGFFVYIWYSYGIHLDVHISFFVINNKCYKKLPDLIKLSPLVVCLNSLSDMWNIYWDYLKIWPNLFIQSCQPPPLIFHFKRISTWQVFYPTSETFLRLPSSAYI